MGLNNIMCVNYHLQKEGIQAFLGTLCITQIFGD